MRRPPALRSAPRSRPGAAFGHPSTDRRDRQDHAGADHRRRRRRGASRRSRRSTPARPRSGPCDRARRGAPPGLGPADDLLPRRDPPLQQGPAGRAPARGRGGPLTLIGATTENPYFEVNSALLSRTPDLRAAAAPGRRSSSGSRRRSTTPSAASPSRRRGRDDAIELLAARSGGDARTALSALERAVETAAAGGGRPIADAEDALQRKAVDSTTARATALRLRLGLDQGHPRLRPRRLLYYLAVMLEGGEDPRFIARRMVILASEDIGNADPQALLVATPPPGGRPGRAARVRAQPRPGGRLPGAGAEVERSTRAIGAADAPRPRARRRAAARYLRDAHYPAPSSAAARATAIRTTSPVASPTSRWRRDRRGERFYEPTDRGFEAELRELRERLASSARRQNPCQQGGGVLGISGSRRSPTRVGGRGHGGLAPGLFA